MTVLNFPEPKERHLSGSAFCTACQHEWMAVVPVGVESGLECPSCGRGLGVIRYEVAPDLAWVCNCGEKLFWLTPEGAMCRRCGITSSDWADA